MMSNDLLYELPKKNISIEDLVKNIKSSESEINPIELRLGFKSITKTYDIDIGSLAYSNRQRLPNQGGVIMYSRCLVAPNSIKPERLSIIKNYIDAITTRIAIGNLRIITAYGKILNFVRFVDWCDHSKNSEVFSNLQSARDAYREYTEHLESRIRSGEINTNTAGLYQYDTLEGISLAMNYRADQIRSGIKKIRRNDALVKKTEIPSTAEVEQLLSLTRCVFEGIHDLVINKKSFPYLMKLPNEDCWVLPCNKRWIAPKSKLESRDSWKIGYWNWDYENGGIADPRTIESKYSYKLYGQRYHCALRSVKNAANHLRDSNNNWNHRMREKLAIWAHNTFLILFFANTGMNQSQLGELPWSDEYSVERESAEFKTIKYRANKKPVEFFITNEFLGLFKKYVAIRKYILKNKHFDKLFFPLSIKNSRMILRSTYKDMKKIFDVDFSNITARQWRAYKADYLIKNTDIKTTAILLQNTEKTVIQSYIEGSEAEQGEDFGNFFSYLKNKIHINSDKTDHKSSPAGHCKKVNNPTPDSLTYSFKPDCINPEGCLFCENYAVHADEKDIRKLLSIHYLIHESKKTATSEKDYLNTFGELISKIERIIELISAHSSELEKLICDLKTDVWENENLDPYWDRKLYMLCKIGAL